MSDQPSSPPPQQSSGPPQGRPPRGRQGGRPFFRKKFCKFCARNTSINYKDIDTLRRFTTDRGKILPRRITGNCAKHQRKLALAIKRARALALVPFTTAAR